MTADLRYVLVEKEGDIAVVYLNRTEAFNALTEEFLEELHITFDTLRGDDSLAAVILTGKGAAFAAGADLQLAMELDAKRAQRDARRGQELMDKIEQFPCPVIGAVNGPAMGGGAELAWACDMRIASENAVFSQPEVSLGFNLGWGGSQRLPYIVGRARAMEFMLLCEPVNAQKALEWGLVNRVVPAEQLLDAALAMARKIARHSRTAVVNNKKVTVDGYRSGGNSMLLESELWGTCFNTDEPRQRIKAFLARLAGKKK